MNRQLDLAVVTFALTIFCGIAAAGQIDKAADALDQSIVVSIDDNANQETRDYYDRKADEESTKLLIYLGATALLGITTLALGFRGSQQFFRDKKQTKYDLEERRHQELLEATRQANHPPPVQERSRPSMLYTSHPQPLTPAPPTIEQILSEAQRMYKAGNIKMAISLLETTNDPRAQKVLVKLRAMKK